MQLASLHQLLPNLVLHPPSAQRVWRWCCSYEQLNEYVYAARRRQTPKSHEEAAAEGRSYSTGARPDTSTIALCTVGWRGELLDGSGELQQTASMHSSRLGVANRKLLKLQSVHKLAVSRSVCSHLSRARGQLSVPVHPTHLTHRYLVLNRPSL